MMERLLVAQIQQLRGSLEGQLRADAGAARSPAGGVPWSPGDRLVATVESLRGPDRALLRIGSYAFDAPATAGAFAGQKLELVFVSASPRVTFALAPEAAREEGPQMRDAGRQVDISGAARRLDSLLAGLAKHTGGALEAQESKPLIQGAPADTKALASALQDHVSRSGMFYESHLENWAEGRMPLERIRQEPQARIPLASQALEPDAGPDETRAAATSENLSLPASGRAGDDPDPVHPNAMPQVKAQLEVLQSGQIAWQGQAWPGQDLRMEIQEEPHAEGDDPEMRVWTSRLRLELPRLGTVEAILQLTGQQLRVRLSAQEARSAEQMRDAQPRLVEQIDDARLSLVQFDVDAAAN